VSTAVRNDGVVASSRSRLAAMRVSAALVLAGLMAVCAAGLL
jgi:hypothetical protein